MAFPDMDITGRVFSYFSRRVVGYRRKEFAKEHAETDSDVADISFICLTIHLPAFDEPPRFSVTSPVFQRPRGWWIKYGVWE
jgi:hypothetical protein